MSAAAEAGPARKSQGHSAGHGAHGTFRSYMTGFVLSVILTAIPFWLVMGDVLNDTLKTGIIIMALAAVQIVVHMIYFLHMIDPARAVLESGWWLPISWRWNIGTCGA